MEGECLGWKGNAWVGRGMPGLEGKTGMEAKCLGWKGRDGRGLDGSGMPRLEGMKGRLEWKRNAWVGRDDWDGSGMDGSGMPGLEGMTGMEAEWMEAECLGWKG